MKHHGQLRDALQLLLPLHGNDRSVQLEDVSSSAVQLQSGSGGGLRGLSKGLVGELDELLDCGGDLGGGTEGLETGPFDILGQKGGKKAMNEDEEIWALLLRNYARLAVIRSMPENTMIQKGR